jgi:hypothetical protein
MPVYTKAKLPAVEEEVEGTGYNDLEIRSCQGNSYFEFEDELSDGRRADRCLFLPQYRISTRRFYKSRFRTAHLLIHNVHDFSDSL